MIIKIIKKIKQLSKLINKRFIYYFFLTKKNKINSWHLYNNLNNRPYKKEIIKFCNQKNFETVLDFGCGFGDIIKSLNSNKKYAYDSDPKIIKISKQLFSKSNINFLLEEDLNFFKKNKIDCVLFINLLHDYNIEQVKQIINPFIGSKYILLDAINQDVKGFKYFHNYDFLLNDYNIQKNIFKEEPDRSFFILEKKYV
tara:strand:+ start:220 stop:813 length:594 start_codon:yes stop_codon:yes gene_type:complete